MIICYSAHGDTVVRFETGVRLGWASESSVRIEDVEGRHLGYVNPKRWLIQVVGSEKT